jgi:hypothetical protein
MGLDFHLFVETVTGKDALVYRDGPTGLRATVLYHRDDGNYGLVDPARNAQ